MSASVIPDPLHLLLIEDDEVDIEAVRRALRRSGMDQNVLHVATDGEEALDMLRGKNGYRSLPQPCVMLVDINMPRMNGLEFLKEVRNDKNLSHNIAFMLTTSGRKDDKIYAQTLNAAGYFMKENLTEFIDLLRFYCNINEFPVRAMTPQADLPTAVTA